MGPAPAVAAVRSAVRAVLPLSRARVIVACSGGADSLALAAAAAFEAPRAGIECGLVTIDHGLQPGSSEQAQRVAAIGYELGLDPVEVIAVDVRSDGSGPEAAARTARYSALDAAAEAWDASVLLGHTLDDQAETVLLGLGRGSGPRSIAGMRVQDGVRLRPLLGLRRAVTIAACRALGLSPWVDPHNDDPSFRRVRLRHEVLPLLEEVLDGGAAEALARTAALVQDDLDALDGWADQHISSGVLEAAALADLPRAIRTRVLRAWARNNGVPALTADHLTSLDELIMAWHGQGPIDLPGGYQATRASGKLAVQSRRPVSGASGVNASE